METNSTSRVGNGARLFLVLFLSVITAQYFALLNRYFYPPISDGVEQMFGRGGALFMEGIIFAYIFCTIFIFEVTGSENRKSWIGGMLVLPILALFAGDRSYNYSAIILGLITFGLSLFLRKIFK